MKLDNVAFSLIAKGVRKRIPGTNGDVLKSLQFDSTSTVKISSITFPTEWTLEFYINVGIQSYSTIRVLGANVNDPMLQLTNNSTGNMLLYITNSLKITASAGGLNYYNTWHHIALVQDATGIKLYRNGVLIGSTITKISKNFTNFEVGGDWYSTDFIGLINSFTISPFIKDFSSFVVGDTISKTGALIQIGENNGEIVDVSDNAIPLTKTGSGNIIISDNTPFI